jgi:hypothetical protein
MSKILQTKINSLNPWFYPVQIGEIKVTPGIGSGLEPDYLSNRIHLRKKLIVDEVVNRYDLSGKKLLDIGCNCGYWSAQYVKKGATSVLGLEGRQKYVDQANLYFSTNKISKNFKFICADIASGHTWENIRERFDLVLCAGILYHIPNYKYVVTRAANLVRDVLVIDTRVGEPSEEFVQEPGDLHFNAIEATRKKVVPCLSNLKKVLIDLNFNVEILPIKFKDMYGLTGGDSYNKGNRVTLFCTK